MQAFDVWRDLSLTATDFGCIWVHSPEHLCKDVSSVVIYDIFESLKNVWKVRVEYT